MHSKALQFLRLPSLFLAAILQVMPLARAALPALETSAEVLAVVFRWAAGLAAALGGVQAVSGASTVITNPLSTNIVEGVPITLRLTTAPDQAHYWTVSGLPTGLALSGTSGQTLWQIVGTPKVSGTFNVALTAKDQSTSGSSRTVTATLVINITTGQSTPMITGPPVSQSVVQGRSASFSVTASGTAPLSYQWRFQSSNLAGQTGSTLVINPAGTANAGNYDVIVSNTSGSTTSAVAVLTVIVPAAITAGPVSQTVTQGQSATFSVTATGSAPLNYQWRFQGANLGGQTASMLVLNPAVVAKAGNYDVIVGNGGGSVTSSVAALTVVAPPGITSPPVSQTVTQGQNAAFSVSANGTSPLTYQWRFKGANLPGQTGTALQLSAATTNDAGSYDVRVANNFGSVTSSIATLTVIVPGSALQIISQPSSLVVTQNQSASFSIGAGGTAPLSYQWRFNGANLPGQTGSNLVFNLVTTNQAGNYDAIVSNGSGAVTSAVATLTVLVGPAILTPPANQSVTVGGTVTFTVLANGTSPLYYQWRKGAASLAGATGPSFRISNAQFTDAGSYSVIVSNAAGVLASVAAVLDVLAAPQAAFITVQPTNRITRSGGSVTFNVSAGGDSPLSYQWFFGGAPIPHETGSTLTVAAATASDAGNYYVQVSNRYGSVTSSVVSLSLTTLRGIYNGLYYDLTGFSVFSSGSLTITTTEQGKYSGSLMLLGRKYPFSGQLDESGNATNAVRRGTLKPLTLELGVDMNVLDQISGRLTDGSWSALVQVDRAVWDAKLNPAPMAGTYTLAIPGEQGSTDKPEGAGFGTVIVDAAGRVQFRGATADGRRVARSSMVSRAGLWPFYSPLYSGEGSLMGWLTITNDSGGDISGRVLWSKLQQPLDRYYPAGFAFDTEVIGSGYVHPAPGVAALAFSAGQMELLGGNLDPGITTQITLLANARASAANNLNPKLAFAPGSGLFGGSLPNPATGARVAFRGIVLQKQNCGLGYFLGSNRSGSVYIGP